MRMPNELMSQEDELLISDPKELKRFLMAAEIIKLHVDDGMNLEAACAQVGISRSTYHRWVKDGVFAPLLSAAVAPLIQDMQIQALDAMKDGLAWVFELMSGKGAGKDATNFDRMGAVRFAWAEFGKPMMAALPQPEPRDETPEDPADEYLKKEPAWANLEPGEQITKTTIVERQLPAQVEGEFEKSPESDPEP
jgi:hypothetical protein